MRIIKLTLTQLLNEPISKHLVYAFVLLSVFNHTTLSADALLDINGSKDKNIRPEIKQQEFKPAKIDTENFEVIAYIGTYDFEGFDVRPIYGVKGSFHLNQTFFLDIDYGNTSIKGRTIPSTPSTAIDESVIRYDAGLGINLMQGQVFWGKGEAFTNQLYVKYSLGKLDIDSQKNSLKSIGLGIRLLHPNDTLSMQIGVNKDNIEGSGGLSNFSNIKFFTGLGFYF